MLADSHVASDTSAVQYYRSLGDSLAAGTNATGVGVAETDKGYADQLHAALAVNDPKRELVKLGCPGESATSIGRSPRERGSSARGYLSA